MIANMVLFNSPSSELFFSCPYVAVAALILRFVGLLFYNMFFHPLRHFPGPKFVAASYFPEFYYDVVQRGMYIWQINNMHERYGMIDCASRKIHG